MATVTSLGFDIFARDRASKVFDKLGKKMEDTEKHSHKLRKAMIAGGAAVGAMAVKFGVDSVKAFAEAQQSQQKLTDAYKRFPAVQDVTLKSLRNMNAELGKKTKFDDDSYAAGEAVLAQYGLTGKQIQKIIPLVGDYAAKTGQDLPAAAAKMGKGILGNTRVFKDMGVRFKDTGDNGKNLTTIMGTLGDKVGGFATKQGKTLQGRLDIMKNQFGEVQESVGQKLVPVLMKLMNFVLTTVLPGINKMGVWMGKNKTLVKGLAIAAGMLYGALLLSAGATKIAAVATKAWGVATKVAGAVSKVFAAQVWVLNAAMHANPIGLVVLALEALVVAFILAWKHSKTFRDVVKGVWKAIQTAASWAWNNVLKPIFKLWAIEFKIAWGIAKTFARIVGAVWKGISTAISWAWKHIIKPIFTVWGTTLKIAWEGIQTLGRIVGRVWGKISDAFWSAIKFIAKIFVGLVGGILKGAAKMFGWVPGVGGKLKKASDNFQKFKDKVNTALGNIKDKRVTVSANFSGKLPPYKVAPVTTIRHKAAGGLLRGPGTTTSDSILVAASDKEFIVNAAQTQKNLPLLHAINNGLEGFAGGGQVTPRVLGLPGAGRAAERYARRTDQLTMTAARIWAKELARSIMAGFQQLMGMGGGRGGSGVGRWADVILRALSLLGQSANLLGAVQRRMNQESGGNPNIVNRWDSNWQRGTPSVGLMQVIGPTFRSYAGPFRNTGPFLYGVSTNPLANVYAGLNYARHRYPSIAYAMNKPGGYDQGGFLQPGWTMAFNGTGRPERVVSGSEPLEVHVYIDGREIHTALLARKRHMGGKGLGLA